MGKRFGGAPHVSLGVRSTRSEGRVPETRRAPSRIGLLFFVVPGLVAFGIDFYTGAIYLPKGVQGGEGPFIRDAVGRGEHAE